MTYQRLLEMSDIDANPESVDFLNPKPNKEMLRTARQLAGINYGEAAKLCGIEESYYRKMERGSINVKVSVYRLILCRAGYIIHHGWEGWKISKGKLWSPVGSGHTPGDIMSIYWLDQSVRTLRAELFQITGQHYDQEYYHGYEFREHEA
jgi:transcriptional regulator with XRE-family HTH domain